MDTEKIHESKARCPKCKSKNITLTEIAEHTITWRQIDGYINMDEGHNEPGNIVGFYGQCDNPACKYSWKFRCLQVTNLIVQ